MTGQEACPTLEHFAEGEIDAEAPGERMNAIGERGYAVINEAGGAAPDDYVAAVETNAAGPVGTALATP
jgi:hypothetical protein